MSRVTVSILLASIPAVAAIVAAVVAGLFAARSKAHERATEHIRELENRISEKKYDVYKPMIDTLRDFFDPAKAEALTKNKAKERQLQEKLADFSIWITIYGSDGAIRAFRNLMQSTYTGAPAQIMMRLYAEFVIAARKDIGRSDTKITPVDVLAIRISDLYTEGDLRVALSESFKSLCRRHNWEAPWLNRS